MDENGIPIIGAGLDYTTVDYSKLFNNPFCVINGDTYFVELITDFVNSEVDSSHIANIALVSMSDVSRYGSIDFDNKGVVIAFKEKTIKEKIK